MSEKFEKQKYLLKKSILEQYSQNNVNIQYSSLWAAKNGESKLIWPIRIVSSLLTLVPIVLKILMSYEIITDSYRSALWVLFICFGITTLLLFINTDWMKSALTLKNKKAKELLALNNRLLLFEHKLEGLYNEVDASSSGYAALQNKFDALCNEFINDINLHDELTGKIDEELAEEARKKTYKIMDIKKLVIYE